MGGFSGSTAATGIGVIRCTCVGSWKCWKLIKYFDQRAQHLDMVGGFFWIRVWHNFLCSAHPSSLGRDAGGHPLRPLGASPHALSRRAATAALRVCEGITNGTGPAEGVRMRVAVTWAGRKGLQGGVGVTGSPPKHAREVEQEGKGAGRGLGSLVLSNPWCHQ